MKKFFIHRFNDMKIRNKLVFSFIVVVIIPVLIVGIFLTYELRQMALDNAIEQTNNDVDRIKKRTAEFLAAPIYVADNALFDQRLKELVNTDYESIFEVVAAYKNYTDFDSIIRYYQEITNIRFYIDNPSMLNNWRFIPDTGQVKETRWFQLATMGQGLMGWYYIQDETKGNEKFLSLVRVINYVEHRTSGMLVINVNTEYLDWTLLQEPTPTLIVDEENNIISTNQREYLGYNLGDVTSSQPVLQGETGRFEAVVFDIPSQIIVDSIVMNMSANDLRIMQIIPNSEIVRDADRFVYLGLIVIFISIIIAFILIYVFSRLISKRLFQLSRQIKKVEEGDLSDTSVIAGKDEVGQLSKQFYLMRESIKKLLKEVEAKNTEKRMLEQRQSEIKLKMLASQINPHFLFNALETIRMKAHMRGEKEISQIVKKLGKLLRRSLEIGGGKISLSDEVELVRAYLDIQQFRFEDRLQYDIHIDPETAAINIPPLIIQPLVENAVIHGLEKKHQGGQVILETRLMHDEVVVQVVDNGIGITEEKKLQIFQSLSMMDDEENRIGLRNVHERLILTYGPKSGLIIDSNYQKGTRVSFRIPVGKKEGDENV
ncbi:two-component system, sensor histidine kinase YesM [Evansella caseinilytica]|uniref:histidine kinase n=1 Tax=Evansella caseinilytica TaxID=1503961 RepID=A0A1H3R0D9_9BACI|nr:sensor histidine kinase [Evansella caseinilytica]SDZ19066.1 two-component system, sensor histidine kinase YesM [Evansella caseinilytica]